MPYKLIALTVFVCLIVLVLVIRKATAATESLGNGFYDHGVATPVSNHRGTVATVDGQGRNIVLLWLRDHHGGYAILVIDAQTGKAEQIPMPFPIGGDCSFSSILSSQNKFYTHYNGYFTEFDPITRKFTFHEQTTPRMAMGMTEDDNGVIWSVTYPNSGVISFNPKTKQLRDYGSIHKENWLQYQRYMAADDTGHLYFAIGNTTSNIIALNPETGKAKSVVPDDERVPGSAYLYRDMNGKVYGQPLSGDNDNWYELYKGNAKKIGKHTDILKKPTITGSQDLVHRQFPDGKILKKCDLINRKLTVEDPETNTIKEVKFDYTSEGAYIMGVAAAPDGTICGGTSFPMRFFSYNPKTDKWINRTALSQWNTVAKQGDSFFAGGYGHGILLQWKPKEKWVDTKNGDSTTNPAFLTQAHPDINRPHKLLAYPDGKTIILAGTPGYGLTGGGLLFWDRETKTQTLVKHNDIIENHATRCIAPLPNRKILAGTSTEPGTGGERKANLAELYIMDIDTKKIFWHEAPLSGIQEYTDLSVTNNGLIYGFADRKIFFIFDPKTKKIVYKHDTENTLGLTNHQQGPQVFISEDKSKTYILFLKGIGEIDPETYNIKLIAESPVEIKAGGDILDGTIYFTSGSHLNSYKIPK